MADAVAHRGPDADGFFVGERHRARPPPPEHRRCRFGSAAARQRGRHGAGSSSTARSTTFRSCATELESRGHRFRTHSDTEVIVHGYEEWGERCVERFRGMFAFAIWDARGSAPAAGARSRRHQAASTTRSWPTAAWSSVPRSSRSSKMPPSIDAWSPEALDAYLTLLYVPAPATIYQHIYKLPPGHILVADRGSVRVSQYWDLEFTGTGDEADEERYLDELDALLTESVRMRLISEVPLGAFLSGGIDSATVVAYMAETSDAPVLASSVGFADTEFNELDKATRHRRAPRLLARQDSGGAGCRGTAAAAGVASRRAIRRFVSGSDLLRVRCRARARDRRALRRRRRRAVGRLRLAPRRAVGIAGAGAPWPRRLRAWPRALGTCCRCR